MWRVTNPRSLEVPSVVVDGAPVSAHAVLEAVARLPGRGEGVVNGISVPIRDAPDTPEG
jgi:hypothetical protein